MPVQYLQNLTKIGSVVTFTERKVRFHVRVVVLGAPKVGKTAIIQQFLYDCFPQSYCATVDEVHRTQYELRGLGTLTLDILDTSGSNEFPAMKKLAIESADAFLLVFSLTDASTFEEVRRLRDLIIQTKRNSGKVCNNLNRDSNCNNFESDNNNSINDFQSPPIVVTGNKLDLEFMRVVRKELAETIINIDWENGYVEASAKDDVNISNIFRELMIQSKVPYDLGSAIQNQKPRRKSLPAYPTSPIIKDKTLPKRNSCAVS
jgi:GTP-binding protein rhes, putative (fragment)